MMVSLRWKIRRKPNTAHKLICLMPMSGRDIKAVIKGKKIVYGNCNYKSHGRLAKLAKMPGFEYLANGISL